MTAQRIEHRRRIVLELVEAGRSTAEIAAELGLSVASIGLDRRALGLPTAKAAAPTRPRPMPYVPPTVEPAGRGPLDDGRFVAVLAMFRRREVDFDDAWRVALGTIEDRDWREALHATAHVWGAAYRRDPGPAIRLRESLTDTPVDAGYRRGGRLLT